MGVKLTSATSFLHRTTGLVAANSNYTGIVWFKPEVDVTIPDYVNVFTYINAGYTAWAGIFSSSVDQNKYQTSVDNGVTEVKSSEKELTAGVWYPLAYRRTGNAHKFYYNNANVSGGSVNITAVTFTELILGYDGFSVATGTFSNFREFNASLTDDEIVAEFSSPTPVKTANLITNCPLEIDLLDTTSNNNDFTSSGTFIFEAGPPLISNSNPDTAMEISSLPFSYTENVLIEEFISDAWFKYTAVTLDRYLGAWAFGNLVDFKPLYTVFESPDFTNAYLTLVDTFNVPIQFPVVPTNTYYFKCFFGDFGDPASLYFSLLSKNNTSYPRGSVFLNDDDDQFWTAVFDSTPGTSDIIGFIDYLATVGEQGGDILENNLIACLDAGDSNKIKITQGLGTVLHTISSPVATSTSVIRTCIGAQNWYLGIPTGFGHVYRINQDGTVDDKGALPSGSGINGLSASNDESIIYIVQGGTNIPVKVWNGSSFLTDLVVGIAGYASRSVLVLSDDSILVLYDKLNDVTIVKRYSPAGATLNTYTLGVKLDSTEGSLCHSVSDPDDFWVRVHGTFARKWTSLYNIETQTGTISDPITLPEYEHGVYTPDETDDPIRFGVSNSCPFFILREGSTPVNPGSGIYKIVPGKRQDTLWVEFDPETTEDVKIPDPQAKTALLGN